jgi:serine protease Do
MASPLFTCVATFLFVSLAPTLIIADTLKITSTPSGATVEIDGVAEGTTPFEKDLPSGYFHRPKTVFGARLEHAMEARVSLEGYVPQKVKLTGEPLNWISLNGRNHGEYWLLKSDRFEVELKRIKQVFDGEVTARTGTGTTDLEPELSLEELARRTKPAVVSLSGPEKSGTGFFITDTGLIATNAHLIGTEKSLETVLPNGEQLEAEVVYLDGKVDIALAKVEGKDFPHLTLADAATVRQGESVLAIGNPGGAMKFSITKGIVSAVGSHPEAGPGTWIQTDASINPGNSGGPLLNLRGEVVGINTLKLVKKDVTGIGFALSASDLIEILRKFYTSSVPATENLALPVRASEPKLRASTDDGVGIVKISGPEGPEITVDGKLVGGVPATLKLSVGWHRIVVNDHKHADWMRRVFVLKDTEVVFKPAFDPSL